MTSRVNMVKEITYTYHVMKSMMSGDSFKFEKKFKVFFG